MFDFLRKQFVDVIEWLEEPGQLAWRVPFIDHEIQNGAQLTVREGQLAAFFNEGTLADYFKPGLYTLDTANLPILTSLMHWDKAFKSPFKSDVVFFSLKEQAGLKWGTTQPITVRDPEFGALRLRAFGSYSIEIDEIKAFASQVLGTLGEVRVQTIEPQLKAAIQTAMAVALGGSATPFIDLAASQQRLSDEIKAEVTKAFAQWGIACRTFFVESVSLPEEVQRHLDKGSSMRVIGDLDRYTRFQSAEAIETAAGESGGVAGVGAGIAAAAAIGGSMSAAMAGRPQEGAPAATDDVFETIEKLHKLLTIGAISQQEFDAKKAELLARLK